MTRLRESRRDKQALPDWQQKEVLTLRTEETRKEWVVPRAQ